MECILGTEDKEDIKGDENGKESVESVDHRSVGLQGCRSQKMRGSEKPHRRWWENEMFKAKIVLWLFILILERREVAL